MSRNAIKSASIVLTAGLAALAQPAAAQLQSAAPFVPTTPPGAMTINGDFHTIVLCNNIVGAKYGLNAQHWDSWVIDKGAGNLLNSLSAPAGPLPTGGIVFVDHRYHPDRLIRWDPNDGVTYMNNQSPWPSGLTSIIGGTSDVVCNDSILLVGNGGAVYQREISGNNAWTWLGSFGTLTGPPAIVQDEFSGVTYAAVAEDLGRLWIRADVCGLFDVPSWNTVGITGQPGDDPAAVCTGVGAGMNGGKFFVTVEYYANPYRFPDLWEAGYDEDSGRWGWFNHMNPGFSQINPWDQFVSDPVAARDGKLLILTQMSGVIEVAYKEYDHVNGAWKPWQNLGSPVGDPIVPDSLTAAYGANRAVVKGESGKFWTLIDNGSGWGWEDRGMPDCR